MILSIYLDTMTTPSKLAAERNGSLSLAGSETSSLTAPSTTRARRNSTTKIIDNRPKHLMLGDFELANVV